MSAATNKRTAAVEYHGVLAEQWEQRYQRKSFRVRVEVLKECLDGQEIRGSSWLDAGCGTGTLSRILAERGCYVTGVDAAPAMVEKAKSLAAKSELSRLLTFHQVDDVAHMEFRDNSFDGILCSSVLEYLADPGACLLELVRVLRPGGMLMVSVPNRESITRRVQVVCRSLGKRLGQDWLKYLEISKNWYSVDEFRRELERCGMKTGKVVIFAGPFLRRIQQSPNWGSLMMFVARRN
jgi:2-polyprenyl-3-methyl-5-hydroxy-6-metoxy-1,4-benzoquinol methylase